MPKLRGFPLIIVSRKSFFGGTLYWEDQYPTKLLGLLALDVWDNVIQQLNKVCNTRWKKVANWCWFSVILSIFLVLATLSVAILYSEMFFFASGGLLTLTIGILISFHIYAKKIYDEGQQDLDAYLHELNTGLFHDNQLSVKKLDNNDQIQLIIDVTHLKRTKTPSGGRYNIDDDSFLSQGKEETSESDIQLQTIVTESTEDPEQIPATKQEKKINSINLPSKATNKEGNKGDSVIVS